MAYTSDIVDIFTNYFPAEELIHYFHILLHADDSLILATTKEILINKFKKLDKYCLENNIKLQLNKCAFLCINTEEKTCFPSANGTINNVSEFVYLGSNITDSGNINNDIKMKIKQRSKSLNKFFAFLCKNYNAPLYIKEKVLESCVTSALLYNCESWGNANLPGLEIQHRKALKSMLGIRNTVCNEFPYVELGKPMLTSIVHKRQLIFYNKCNRDDDWPMQRYIIRKAIDSNSPFIKHYIDLNRQFKNPNYITDVSLKNMQSQIRQKADSNKSRYITYLKLNPTLSRPKIYNSYIPTKQLLLLTRIRNISHNLQMEKGRQRRNIRLTEQRVCICGDIEDEEHFLKECNKYIHIRNKYSALSKLPIHLMLENINMAEYINDLASWRELITKEKI